MALGLNQLPGLSIVGQPGAFCQPALGLEVIQDPADGRGTRTVNPGFSTSWQQELLKLVFTEPGMSFSLLYNEVSNQRISDAPSPGSRCPAAWSQCFEVPVSLLELLFP